ncbi:hypothetical protein GCM10020219_074140 [Nonomuraea dietziae]
MLSARALRRAAERLRPDAILVACTGPVVDVLVAEVFDGLRPRPVFVTGLPGISVPATEKAWLYRSGCDLFRRAQRARGRRVRRAGRHSRRGRGGGPGQAAVPA